MLAYRVVIDPTMLVNVVQTDPRPTDPVLPGDVLFVRESLF